jgi:hypothetical protein
MLLRRMEEAVTLVIGMDGMDRLWDGREKMASERLMEVCRMVLVLMVGRPGRTWKGGVLGLSVLAVLLSWGRSGF